MAIQIILEAFYFMLPAYFANMAPVLCRKLFKNINYPLDFNKTLNKKPILGKNKTFKGLFFGVLFAVIVAFLQFKLQKYNFFSSISIMNYNNWLVIGFLFGFGAITGDAVKSFIKRRFNIKPGTRFVPWDQIDFVIGALLFISAVYVSSIKMIIVILIMSFLLHILSNHFAYYTKIRKEKW